VAGASGLTAEVRASGGSVNLGAIDSPAPDTWPYVVPHNATDLVRAAVYSRLVATTPGYEGLRTRVESLVAEGVLEFFDTGFCGRGVRVTRDVQGTVGVYAGHLYENGTGNSSSDYVFRFGSDKAGLFGRLEVDQEPAGEAVLPWFAGCFNHCCKGATVRAKQIWYQGRVVVVFETIGLLRSGTELRWDYNDGHAMVTGCRRAWRSVRVSWVSV